MVWVVSTEVPRVAPLEIEYMARDCGLHSVAGHIGPRVFQKLVSKCTGKTWFHMRLTFDLGKWAQSGANTRHTTTMQLECTGGVTHC